MTLEELCQKYKLSEDAIKNHFTRVKNNIYNQYGITIVKEGRGSSANYLETIDASQITSIYEAMAIYEESKEAIPADIDVLLFQNLEFHCFLGIVLSPFVVFRGNYNDFTKYLGLKTTKSNVDKVIAALEELEKRDIISIHVDDSIKEDVIYLFTLKHKVEKEMKIGLDMIKTCKQIAEENHKREWIPLLKVWLSLQILYENQPFTMKKISEMTGLSEYTIRESKKLLEKNYLFQTSKAYLCKDYCIGSTVELNAFYNKDYE